MMTIEIFAPAVLRIRSRCSTMTHIHSLRGAQHADINDIYLGKNNPNIIGLILYKDTASQELINLARHTKLFLRRLVCTQRTFTPRANYQLKIVRYPTLRSLQPLIKFEKIRASRDNSDHIKVTEKNGM